MDGEDAREYGGGVSTHEEKEEEEEEEEEEDWRGKALRRGGSGEAILKPGEGKRMH